MASNIISQSPFSATGVRPGQWFLTSSEEYTTLITPGYLNSVSSAGIDFNPNDIIYAQYNDGANFGMFIVSVDNGTFSMDIYSPNSNSFVFQHTMFVAKGGSDLNSGTSIGAPKLTVQAAINALAPNLTDASVVNIMDGGTYNENLVLPLNLSIYGPNATLLSTTGDTITVQDSGQTTLSAVRVASLKSDSGLAINVLGPNSVLYSETPIIQGDIYSEGVLLTKNGLSLIDSTVTIAANSQAVLNFTNLIGSTLVADPTATVAGSLGVINPGDTKNTIYGNTAFNDRLIYQTTPNTVTAGLTVGIDDSNTRIVYNNASNGNLVLPETSDAAIPIGTNIEFTQLGLGAIEFIAGQGVTIISLAGGTVKTTGPGSSSNAWKYTDTVWVISGSIEPIN
jgi:hypothetical protein